MAHNIIDAEHLKAEIERLQKFNNSMSNNAINSNMRNFYDGEVDCCKQILSFIDSLQQDDTQVDKILCSQIWWEEQGWIMIPPDATIEGIDSLLKQVRKKLQQEQPDGDLEKEIEKYCRIYYNCNYPDQVRNGRCSPIMPHIVEAARYFYKLRPVTEKKNDK